MNPKQRPILFSGPMVRAILDGRKTETRRVIKPQPPDEPFCVGRYSPAITDRRGEQQPGPEVFGACTIDGDWAVKCRYGAPGDELWVRETFCQKMENGRFVYNADGNLDPTCYWYAADGEVVVKDDGDGGIEYRADGTEASPWKPSIHMPRDASRITLRIESVHAEQLQDGLNDETVRAEGFFDFQEFVELWDRLQPPQFQYLANPWVWVVTFERIK